MFVQNRSDCIINLSSRIVELHAATFVNEMPVCDIRLESVSEKSKVSIASSLRAISDKKIIHFGIKPIRFHLK